MQITRTCLYINNSPQPDRKTLAKLGGGGKSLLSLLSFLPVTGWRAHVVVPGEGQFTEELARNRIPHTIYPFRPIEWRRPVDTLRTTVAWHKLFRKVRPSIIHANGFDLSRSFALAAGMERIPYISHVRFPVEITDIRWTLRGLYKPGAFIFNSHAMMNKLWPPISALASKSMPFVVHNAVDLEEFHPAPWPDCPTLRIGIIANFAPFKRHEDFLRMAAEMLKVRQDLEFWVVGEDTQGTGRRNELESLAQELGLFPKIRFLGHRRNIPDIMRELHLVVIPSRFEPFGRVAIEAMACGRPVIGSNDGGLPEIIDDDRNGYLIDVGKWKEFASKGLFILSHKDKWLDMSRNAITAAEDRFSLRMHAEQVTRIYESIAMPREST